MMGSRYISLLLAAAIMLGPTTSFADPGFDFAEGDATAPSDNSGAADGAAGFSFQEGEATANTNSEPTSSNVVVIAIPGPAMSPKRRLLIENKMNAVLRDIPSQMDPQSALKGMRDVILGRKYLSSDTILNDLQQNGMIECVREKLCLGRIGEQHNLDGILFAQLVPNDAGGLSFKISFFNVKDRLEGNSDQRPVKTDQDIIDAIDPMIYKVYDIHHALAPAKPREKSIISPVLAWSSLVLSLGAAGAGGYFTYQAKKLDDQLNKDVDAKKVTQIQANSQVETIKQKQTVSFVFYGVAAGLAATSVVFFLLDIGSDVSEDQDTTASIQDLKLAPTFSRDGAGIAAGFNF